MCARYRRRVDLRLPIHLVLHAAVPLAVAALLYRDRWRRAALVMLATMAVDLDHLLADPVFDPGRCSVGFHPGHSYWAIGAYALLTLHPRSRLVGLGLMIHMALDQLDCWWMAA